MPGETVLKLKRKTPDGDLTKSQMVVVELQNEDGQKLGPPLNIPSNSSVDHLNRIVNQLLEAEEPFPYAFYCDQIEVIRSIEEDILAPKHQKAENLIVLNYVQQSVFRVNALTRSSSNLSGHDEAILSVVFSPDGSKVATGSGDKTIRIWDLNTETPIHCLEGHTNWVQTIAWSPDGQTLASGSMDTTVRLWNVKTGKQIGQPLRLHTQAITSIAWEPFMKNVKCTRFASASQDGSVRIWDAIHRKVLFVLSQHTAPVTAVLWGGEDRIYTASRDRTIKVWDAKDGKLIWTLEGHAHWVNHIALSTDFALKTGPFGHDGRRPSNDEEALKVSIERYEKHKGPNTEHLVSCSDDYSIFLWDPTVTKKPITRLTGHQQLVNHVCFSPDGRFLASASFDKSVKIWNGKTGKFMVTLRGHVGPVYRVVFSADSRLLMSASKDSTCKIWNLRTQKLMENLPGHADEVFAVDWSPTGKAGASGGKDKMLRIWRH